MLGGHQTHVVMNIPGGVRKGLTEEQRADIEEKAKGFIEFSKFSLKIFEDVVLGNQQLCRSDTEWSIFTEDPFNGSG